jgi:DNA-binding response OmpR family regulator
MPQSSVFLTYLTGIIRLTIAYFQEARHPFRRVECVFLSFAFKDAREMAGKKILIVEDENLQLTALARRLRSAGFEVVAARDGMTAISTARKEQPDLVLLDLGLPAGDGFSVLQRLQMLISTNTIPVIVVSSRDARTNRDAAIKAGAIAYYQKPVDVDVLLKNISEALGLAASDSASSPASPASPTPQS